MKTRIFKLVLFSIVMSTVLTACGGLAFLQYPNEIDETMGRKVTATIKRSNVLGFTPARNMTALAQALQKKCDGGKVNNITYEMVRKSYIFVVTTEVTATGYCCCEEVFNDEDSKKKKKKKRRRR